MKERTEVLLPHPPHALLFPLQGPIAPVQPSTQPSPAQPSPPDPQPSSQTQPSPAKSQPSPQPRLAQAAEAPAQPKPQIEKQKTKPAQNFGKTLGPNFRSKPRTQTLYNFYQPYTLDPKPSPKIRCVPRCSVHPAVELFRARAVWTSDSI